LSQDEFEVVIVESPRIEFDIPRERLLAFIRLAEELGWDKARVKRYISTALRLRRIEREHGRSYASLVRSYQKLSSEEAKLRYAIEQLVEKRRRIEEDLRIYLEQHKLTLDLVQRIAKILEAMRRSGLEVDDLERSLNVIKSLKGAGYDVGEVLDRLKRVGVLEEEIRSLEERRIELEQEISSAEEAKRSILREIEEIHGLSGEISELMRAKGRLEEEVKRAEERLRDTMAKLESLKSELEEVLGSKATIEDLKLRIQQAEEELRRLEGEREELIRETAEMLGAKREIGEIRRRLEEERQKLEAVAKEVANREAYLEILEGEISAAHAILRIFADPQGVDVDDLESLIDHLQKILKIKRGELPALRALEPHMLNRVRESIISLIMPYIKSELVPKRLFDQLEREVRRLNERREALERELASLKQALEARVAERSTHPRSPPLRAFGADGSPLELRTLDQGKKVRIICPVCKASSITSIPTREELEDLASKSCRLEFVCGECGNSLEIPLEILLKRVEG